MLLFSYCGVMNFFLFLFVCLYGGGAKPMTKCTSSIICAIERLRNMTRVFLCLKKVIFLYALLLGPYNDSIKVHDDMKPMTKCIFFFFFMRKRALQKHIDHIPQNVTLLCGLLQGKLPLLYTLLTP